MPRIGSCEMVENRKMKIVGNFEDGANSDGRQRCCQLSFRMRRVCYAHSKDPGLDEEETHVFSQTRISDDDSERSFSVVSDELFMGSLKERAV